MKTLQQITEGMFDVEDNAEQGFEESKMDKFLKMLGDTKVEFEIIGNDFIADTKNTRGVFHSLGKAPFIEAFGRTFDKLILQGINTFWIPNLYTSKNYTKVIEINPVGNCYIRNVGNGALVRDVTIDMNTPKHELLSFKGVSLKNCIINIKESNSNLVVDGPDNDLEFLKGTTVNLGKYSRLSVTPGKTMKSQLSKLFGELYYHYRKFGTSYAGKAAPEKILIKDVKTKKYPHWLGTMLDEHGRPMMTRADIDKIIDFLGFKLNCNDLDYFIFGISPTEILQFNTQNNDIYACEYFRISY